MNKSSNYESHVQTLRGLYPEDLLSFSWLQEIALSPEGDRLAYTVKRPVAGSNGYQIDLYLVDMERDHTLKLTEGTGAAAYPAWSRDGSRLAFVWRGSDTQIVITDGDGANQRAYSMNLAAGSAPAALDWSPDGKTLAFCRWVEVRAPDLASIRPGIPAPTIRVIRRLRYKQDGVGWVENRFRHIHQLNLETGDSVQLTGGECDYGEPRWSWDGGRLAFTMLAREQNTLLGQGQIGVYHCDTGEIERLMPDWRGAAVCPQWRADDEAIVFAGYCGEPPVNRRRFYHVWLVDLGSGEVRDLSCEHDQTVGNYAVSDMRAGLTNVTVQWPAGRGRIYFLLTEQGATHLYSVDQTGACRLQVGGKSVTFSYSVSNSGRVAYGQASPTCIGELYVQADGATRQLTRLNPWLNSCRLSEPIEYWYDGLDGKKVHAWVMRPVDAADKPCPTIVYVHCSMFSWDFSHEFQCLANAGFVVAYFNQRGTTAGYGQEHAMGNYYGKHLLEFQEIMLGVDDLVKRPYVDAKRLGVTGGSCGGFMTNWIVGHTNRFAAAVTQRSVTDLVSKFGTSDNGPEQAESEGARAPWVDVHQLWKSSPIAYANQIHTPLLILHSDEDHRCALGQAEELYAALRWLGRQVEMVIFQGESHGLSRGGRPGNRIERLWRILGWFNRYL